MEKRIHTESFIRSECKLREESSATKPIGASLLTNRIALYAAMALFIRSRRNPPRTRRFVRLSDIERRAHRTDLLSSSIFTPNELKTRRAGISGRVLRLKERGEEIMKSKKNLMSILIFPVACLLAVGTAMLTTAQAQFSKFPVNNNYSLTDLDASTLWSFGYAINNAGQAVGDFGKWIGYNQSILRAFRTSANQTINPWSDDLGVLFNDYRSYAHAINNNGVVVGDSVALGGPTRAFQYGAYGAGIENLHPTSFVATDSYARGISDYNWIVGYYQTQYGSYTKLSHAMLSFGPGWTYSLDSWFGYPAQSEAYDVNNLDQIVGWLSPTIYSQPGAFLFDAAANVFRLIKIGTLPGGIWSKAYGVNDSGQVVGQADKLGWPHAFLWKDANNNGISDAGEMRDLDTMGNGQSGAMGISNNGTAVGYYGNPDVVYGNSRACIFYPNGQMVDLNTLIPAGTGWTLRMANGINDNGQIVGWMEDQNPDQQARIRHAFRLNPPPARIIIINP